MSIEDSCSREECEPIEQIIQVRKRIQENRLKEQELESLRQERKALQLQDQIRREKERIEKYKSAMDQPKRFWCLECNRWEDKKGNPV